MAFLYHMVPKEMVGETLYPLADLKSRILGAHEREIKKYDDHPKRKMLPQRLVKKIGCRQEEVLHFCPIHPHLIFSGLKSIFPDWSKSVLFYEIPIDSICGLSAVCFDMNKTGKYVFGEDEPEELFERVTPENYQILKSLPKEALDFYQQWKDRGERGAPFMGRVPHVMVQGHVSVAGCRVIDWRDQVGSV